MRDRGSDESASQIARELGVCRAAASSTIERCTRRRRGILAGVRRPRRVCPLGTGLPTAVAGVLILCAAGSGQAQEPPRAGGDTVSHAPGPPLRIFFIANVHSRHARLDEFIEAANRELPDLVLDGGDMVHDGTETEFRHAWRARARLKPPWHGVRGNHDAALRGPFSAPPPAFADFQAFEHQGVRFVLLDNHAGVLNEEQLGRLEAELERYAGHRMVVVMHVPPILTREHTATRLRHLLPYPLARPSMHADEQVERFTELVEHHGVLAVLAGHTHAPDYQTRGGVHYIVAGAAGGLTPGWGIANEYVDITLRGFEVEVRRVALGEPPRDPLSFFATAFRFFARVNGFNHAEQGWNYTPSTSVQLKGALQRIETRAGEDPAFFAAASFERVLGDLGRQAFFVEPGVSAGPREFIAHLGVGYKLRPIGTFNENLYLAAAATANAGLLAGTGSAGVGQRLGIGVELRDITIEVSRHRATNQRGAAIVLGRRF
jgi:predicted phosphodiesterase